MVLPMNPDPDSPPDFGKTGYPSGGARIGTAWLAAWRVLCDGQWHNRAELTPVMMEAGDVVSVTTENLLRSARRFGILETRRTKRADGGCGYSDYRIKA